MQRSGLIFMLLAVPLAAHAAGGWQSIKIDKFNRADPKMFSDACVTEAGRFMEAGSLKNLPATMNSDGCVQFEYQGKTIYVRETSVSHAPLTHIPPGDACESMKMADATGMRSHAGQGMTEQPDCNKAH